jgi:ribonuclease-3
VGVPRYSVTESGPDHQKSFVATVHMGEADFGQGQGKNKKEAEQAAAQAAWQVLNEQPETLPASE